MILSDLQYLVWDNAPNLTWLIVTFRGDQWWPAIDSISILLLNMEID